MAKVLFFVVSPDADKINSAVDAAIKKNEGGDEVRFVLFGPAEKFVVGKPEIMKNVDRIKQAIMPKACIFIAKENKIEEELRVHFELLPTGEYLSKSVEDGFSVITI